MVKYLSFHNSNSIAFLRYFLMSMARPQCDTPQVVVLAKRNRFGLEGFRFVSNHGKYLVLRMNQGLWSPKLIDLLCII
jgi:hypothetical protein